MCTKIWFHVLNCCFSRIIWLIIIILSLGGLYYMVLYLHKKNKEHPVFVSYSSRHTPVHNIPFPTVSICPQLQTSLDELTEKIRTQNYEPDEEE